MQFMIMRHTAQAPEDWGDKTQSKHITTVEANSDIEALWIHLRAEPGIRFNPLADGTALADYLDDGSIWWTATPVMEGAEVVAQEIRIPIQLEVILNDSLAQAFRLYLENWQRGSGKSADLLAYYTNCLACLEAGHWGSEGAKFYAMQAKNLPDQSDEQDAAVALSKAAESLPQELALFISAQAGFQSSDCFEVSDWQPRRRR